MLNRKMQPAAVPPPAVVARSALKDRLLDPRTLISFGILVIVLVVVLTHVQFDYGASLRAISQTNVIATDNQKSRQSPAPHEVGDRIDTPTSRMT